MKENKVVKVVKIGKNNHYWMVQTTKQGKFKIAYLILEDAEGQVTHEEMNRTIIGPDEEVDLDRMQVDANNFPKIEGVRRGNTYAYCFPVRNSRGQIMGWTCGGSGPYTCL